MEQYIVSARKYRPSTFSSVVGQGALTSTLKNAIATDRLAHAYLFCGSRGVGKTSCARIFAKTINCTNPTADGEACNECDSCRAFNEGNSMNIIELDAASNNGVDDIRALIEQVQIPPSRGRYRVFIIDEVHMLSSQAFNAFLKTLEEPPSYVIFILATTEKHKIIPTILSRCQIYDFNRISIKDMVEHLTRVARAENITVEPAALNVIARQADGAMRDALSIFDQVAASSRGNITYERTIESLNVLDSSHYSRLLECCTAGDIPGMLVIFHAVRAKGFDPLFFINGLGAYLRDIMLAGAPATQNLVDVPADVLEQMKARAAKLPPKFLYAAMGLCNDCDLNYRQSSNKQLLVELTLIRIAQLLSPSPADSGRGEGPLKPLKQQPQAGEATATAEAPAPYKSGPAVPSRPATQSPRAMQAQAQAVAAEVPQRPAQRQMRVGALSMADVRTRESAQAPGQEHSAAYTAADVARAWDAYIAANQTEHALVNVMRQRRPAEVSPGKYVVTLGNEVENGKICAHATAITAAMRTTLQNDSFSFEVQVVDEGLQPMFWNERQVLGYMYDKYPAFKDFYRAMELNLM